MRKSSRAASRVLRFETIEPRCMLSSTVGCDLPVVPELQTEAVAAAVETPAVLWGGVPETPSASLVPKIEQEYGLTGEGQTIAVIDTGIAYDHLALGNGYGTGHRVVGGYDFAENDANPYDDGPLGGHGTHVAGILGSTNYACPGVAPGADLVALRVFDDSGHGEFAWVEQALDWVHDHRNDFEHPITTVNLSLGSAWNGDAAPDWAMLEDEFAQLDADGIFIAVAAGNSFQQYNQPGTSYPAASDYVTPVASVDGDGSLSFFSQRSDRTIAAPGRSILSTVPDYLGDQNGRADDYARFSGTSMAAPFVAGASMLLRQAYESVGVTHITGQTLYDVMAKTADDVFDALTGKTYHRLNLERAIDAALAERPGVPQEPDTQDPAAQTPVDWGTVAQATFAGAQLDAAGKSYSLSAARDGILTIVAQPPATVAQPPSAVGGNVAQPLSTVAQPPSAVLELYRADGRLAARGTSGRIDVDAVAGERFTLKAFAPAGSVTTDFRVTNLVSQSGLTVRVAGTDGDDQFVFHAGARPEFSINGTVYTFDAAKARLVEWDGGAGSDRAELVGTAGAETVALRPLSADLSGAGYEVRVCGAEQIAVDTRGGYDRATFADSAGDDQFTAQPLSATMVGAGFRNQVANCRSIFATASAGSDTASIHDSSGNDTLVASPKGVTLSGAGFFLSAAAFDRVSVQATGGNDVGVMYDSVGDDLLAVSSGKTMLRGAGFENTAAGFDTLMVFATAGGKDRAVFAVDPATDRLTRSGWGADLASPQGSVRTRYFEEVLTTSSLSAAQAVAIESLVWPQGREKKSAAVDAILAQDISWL